MATSSTKITPEILNKVKNHLRVKNIKLWLPPYTNQEGIVDNDAVDELATEISKDLMVPSDTAILCLHELRHHAVERLRQNENYKKNNIATLKIKCSSQQTEKKSEFEIIEVKLDVNGEELKRIVADKLKITEDMKLICSGRVLRNDSTLESQRVKHNSVILCLVIPQSSRNESAEVEQALIAVKRARKGAELLAKMGSDDDNSFNKFDVQITDQKGQALDLPDEEKQSLTVALGLHEKGRAILQKKNYELSLLLLLEADKEFRECRAEILSMVDNYAVLCLDIVWCYVCTKNISALPDAKIRLEECETAFKKSYGVSLQRLLALKGSSGNEIALFVRLYLLQAIVFYHEGTYKEAYRLLEKARGYAKMVITPEESVTEMMTIGLSEREARRALRANKMNVDLATQWAYKQREEHKLIKKQEKEKKRIKSLQKKFGSCANGDPVNIDTYEQLVNLMGFEPSLAAEALKQANNEVSGAIEMIDNNTDQLREAAKLNSEKKVGKIKEKAVDKLKAMGFDETSAKACLNHFSGAVEEAAEYLGENVGNIPPEWIAQAKATLKNLGGAGTSGGLTKEEEALVKDVADDVSKEEDDQYLDIKLDEEMQMIDDYLTLIASIDQR